MLAVQDAPDGRVTPTLLEPGAAAGIRQDARRTPPQTSYLKHKPRTLAECDQLRAIINNDVTDIQLQLKDESRRDTMDMVAYLDWERRAKKALIYKQAQLRELKALRHDLNMTNGITLPLNGPRSESTLLRRCVEMFNRLRDEGVEFSPVEEGFIDILSDVVGHIEEDYGQ